MQFLSVDTGMVKLSEGDKVDVVAGSDGSVKAHKAVLASSLTFSCLLLKTSGYPFNPEWKYVQKWCFSAHFQFFCSHWK